MVVPKDWHTTTPITTNDNLTNYPGQQVNIDELDESMPYDQMIYNLVNTQLGMTMKRKIYQFSNPYYDNFHVIEYTFINTGNINDDDEIERESGTLEEVYFYFQHRFGFNYETRILIGDPTSWGANTMNSEVGPYPAGGDDSSSSTGVKKIDGETFSEPGRGKTPYCPGVTR